MKPCLNTKNGLKRVAIVLALAASMDSSFAQVRVPSPCATHDRNAASAVATAGISQSKARLRLPGLETGGLVLPEQRGLAGPRHRHALGERGAPAPPPAGHVVAGRHRAGRSRLWEFCHPGLAGRRGRGFAGPGTDEQPSGGLPARPAAGPRRRRGRLAQRAAPSGLERWHPPRPALSSGGRRSTDFGRGDAPSTTTVAPRDSLSPQRGEGRGEG